MRRYRIGLMVGNKSVDYVRSVRMGIQNTLEAEGHILVAISDLIPFHSRINTISHFRVAFEIAARLDLDALIVPAGIITGYLKNDHASLYGFLNILDPSRTLVIERTVDGYRCVGKDSVPGMRDCIRYLIETCGFTKIGFVGGPETSNGARVREGIYRDEMERHGLAVPSRLVVHGDYSGECPEVIEKLIDENPDLEAIACCCDLIAYTAYDIMRERGLSVGKDIAVTGFDDLPLSAHMDPPLSTVHLTGYDLGCMAAREAIRMCAELPQQESVLTSSFVARGSCGEGDGAIARQFENLLAQDPIPTDRMLDILVDHTLSMASERVEKDFRGVMGQFFDRIMSSYTLHTNDENADGELFESQDLGALFHRTYRECLSLEGFQSAAIALLQALMSASGESNASWIVEQIANLHHGIARMLNVEASENRRAVVEREWTSFQVINDAVRESDDITHAYELILRELHKLGIRQADLYLFPEPVAFMGSRSFALSDTLLPIGRLVDGGVVDVSERKSIDLPELLTMVMRDSAATLYTVGGIMAGNELMGVAAFDCGTLDDDGQLIAFLNLGIALKHLQMIANDRETNELLSRNNLKLERQSHYDEMTGVFNRRGFMNGLNSLMRQHIGERGTLFYLDLDGLKFINDSFGHDAGDEAIRQATRVLQSCLPSDTVLGRLGGDEFVAFTLSEDGDAIGSIGSSIDTGMRQFNETHSYPFDLSISYGGVCIMVNETSFTTINQTMMLADERLYEMKKFRGRGRRYAG